MKITGVIQARMGSTRLPNKMMLSLHSKPIIEWVVKRTMRSSLDEIILATSTLRSDDVLAKYALSLGVKVFRGDEQNVLKRFYDALQGTNSTHLVRICADNPLIDPLEIDNLIAFYKATPCDYAYNHIPRDNLYPDGLGAEIVSYELFSQIYSRASLSAHKEHCLSYIWDNKQEFDIKTFDPSQDLLKRPDLKFDVDTFDDYYKLAMKDFDINVRSDELVQIFGEKNEA